MIMKQLFRHTSTLLRTALLLGAILLFGTGMKGQTAGLPDAFETMDPATIIGDGQYYYIQFYQSALDKCSYLTDCGVNKIARSKDFLPYANNRLWTLEAAGDGVDTHFRLRNKDGHYISFGTFEGSQRVGCVDNFAAASILTFHPIGSGGYYITAFINGSESYPMYRPSYAEWAGLAYNTSYSNGIADVFRLRFAKLKSDAAFIIYYRGEGLNNDDPNAATTRHYLTYSGTDNSVTKQSDVSSRQSIIPSNKPLSSLPTLAAYHKDGLWTLEETGDDGGFYIKKYGTNDYLINSSGNYSILGKKDELGAKYRVEDIDASRYTPVMKVNYVQTALTKDMFKTWDGDGAGAAVTNNSPGVDFNVGNNAQLGTEAMVAGTSNVNNLIYADLSEYSMMVINGTQDMQLRVLMSRQESDSGPWVEKDVTIGGDGKAVVNLRNLGLTNGKFATQTTSATVKMTYVDGSNGTYYNNSTNNMPDTRNTSYGEIAVGSPAYCGFNKISGDNTVNLANVSYGVNNIAYLQVDATAINGTITKVTLKGDFQQITARALQYGVGYNNSTWSSTMTWNTADRSITTLGEAQYVTNSSSNDAQLSFDITGAFTDSKIRTILVYNLVAGGGYIKNPTVEVEYTPSNSGVNISFAHLNAIKTGYGGPTGTINSITLLKENDNRYLHHSSGDGYQVDQWTNSYADLWNAGFYPVEVVDKDEFYQVLLKYGDNMVGVESDQTAALKPYNDFNPDLWDLEQVDDYGHFRFRWWNGTCYNGIGNALTTADPTGNDIGIYSNSNINSMFTVQWLPKTEKRIPYDVTHKESNVRLYYTYNPTTPARQKVYGQQGLITDADSEWWDRDKGTQKVNEFIITHYVKKGETVEFGLPTVLTDHNDHRLFQRWYNYDDDRDLTGLKNHFRLKAGGVEVMSYLYNNGIVTGEKLDWGTIFPGARTFELNYLSFNNCDGESFTLAADVSRYSDFEYANASSHLEGNLQEPSLTMRYIYVMHDAKVMARDLMDNTEGSDNWLETKDFHFPATRVAYETSKPEKYQGEFIGIKHQFKDYWVFNTTDQNAWTDNNLESAVTNSTSGHIEVVVDANGTGITLGGKDNKGYYLYDEGKNDNVNSKTYGDSRFVAFKYPASGTVLATGEDHPAYVKVYFNYNDTRYQIAKFKIIFDENTSTLPWTSVNSSAQVKGTDRDPKNLEKKAGRPIAKVSFDYPTGATFKNSSEYNIHNNRVMEGLWGEIANSSPLPLTFEKTNYGFDGDNPSWGSYALVTTMPTRYGNEKTTMPANDATYGYGIAPDAGMQSAFLYIDASEQPGDICAIPFTGEFCSGDKLMCTGWISGSNRMFNDNRCPGSVILTVKGETFDGEEVPIYRFCPGQCYELDNGTGIDGVTDADHVVWQQFYFEFSISRKFVRQWVEVNNNCVSSTGGDFMLDNIEVYAMVPEVDPEMNTPLCVNNEYSELRLLKLDVGFEKLIVASGVNTTVTEEGDHNFGIVFLDKEVFLKKFQEGLKNYNSTDLTLAAVEANVNAGLYQDINSTYKQAYEAAFDAALLGTPDIWDSNNPTDNEGAGILNFHWNHKFENNELFSFAKAVNRLKPIFRYTDPVTNERQLIMNGNYPKLNWKPNTDYYLITYNAGITDVDRRFIDFNICSDCNKAKVFQLDSPLTILSIESSDITRDYAFCEGKIPTLLADLKGYSYNGEEVPLKNLNFDWWLGDLSASPAILATLDNYHSQASEAGVRLDVALSTLRSYYPDVTSLDGLSATGTLTSGMIEYLHSLVDAGQLVLHQKSINIPAQKASKDDPYFYLVACPIHDGYFDLALNHEKANDVAYFCDEPQGLRLKVGEKSPSLKCGFVAQENGFSSYDYTNAGAVLSIRLAKKEQFETVQHGDANGTTQMPADNAGLHYLWLPIRNAQVQSDGSTKVIQKSADENIYLASTDDPTWDENIYTAMNKYDTDGNLTGSLPVVGKIVQLNAIDVAKSTEAENDNNRLCVYFTENFEVREGYNYTLSLPFQESPGSNVCDGTLLINLKIVPDYEVWTGGAGNTDWNNDQNWRRADGNMVAPSQGSTNESKRNNNELLVSAGLPNESKLKDYVTNYDNYRTPKDRILRKGFAPLYCTHILMKSNEWGNAPVLYDALNGKNDLDAAPFPNLNEDDVTYHAETSIDQRFTTIDALSGQSFAIVNESEGKALYGTYEQNLGYNGYATAIQETNSGYYFKLESVSGGYLFRLQTPAGEPYSVWGKPGYLNSQLLSESVSFILGLNGWNNEYNYGQDGDNLALWTIEADGSGKFALRNLGTGKYLKDNSNARYDAPTYFTFCTLKTEDVPTTIVNGKANLLKYDMQARLYDIWTETYADEPNKGRDGDLIAEMYQINSCDEIAFQPGAELLNAHLLNYNNAWVEYQLDNDRWYLLGSSLQGTIAGEWYAPTGTAQQKTTYYEPVWFGEGYDRYSPAIYQRSWDKAKAVLYEVGAAYSTDDDSQTEELGSGQQGYWDNSGQTVTWNERAADRYLDRLGYKPFGNKKANVAMRGIWSNTYNDATVDYANGGFSVMVKNNLKNNDQSGGKALVRLPKEDTMYDYYRFSETGAADGGTDTNLSDVRSLNRAKNRGRLKTDLLLPLSGNGLQAYEKIQRTEKSASKYGDARTYTRVPTQKGTNALPMTLRNIEETVSAGSSNLGYNLVENPFQTGLNMNEFFSVNDGLEKKYWLLTPSGQQLVQMAATGEWITQDGSSFSAADAVLAPGQGFFVQATTAGGSTGIQFTDAMQAQTRFGKKSNEGTQFTIVVGTKQKMTTKTETITMEDNSTETVTVEVPVVDASGNYELEDITEDITIYSYVQDKGDGKDFPLKARTRSADDADDLGMVITAERGEQQSSALVMQREGASNDFLPEEDTEVFINSDFENAPTVYTLCGRLATTINSIHDFRSLPIGVESTSDAPCTLTFQGVEMLMSFKVSGQTQNRYYLVRSLNKKEAAEETHLQIFTEGLTARVIASTAEPITVVRCFDTAGRLICTASPQLPEYSFDLPRAGVYIIDAQTEHDRKTMKVVVR